MESTPRSPGGALSESAAVVDGLMNRPEVSPARDSPTGDLAVQIASPNGASPRPPSVSKWNKLDFLKKAKKVRAVVGVALCMYVRARLCVTASQTRSHTWRSGSRASRHADASWLLAEFRVSALHTLAVMGLDGVTLMQLLPPGYKPQLPHWLQRTMNGSGWRNSTTRSQARRRRRCSASTNGPTHTGCKSKHGRSAS